MPKYLFICIIASLAFAQEPKPFLGAALATTHNDDSSTVFVYKLVPDSGADLAGMKEKDEIIAIEGLQITHTGDIDKALDHLKPGDKVSVSVKRGRKRLTFLVTLGTAPPIAERLAPIVGERIAGIFSMGHYWFGFKGIDMSAQLASNMSAPQGILINHIFEEGPAQDAGLMPGDILSKVAGKTIRTQEALGTALSSYKEGSKVPLEIHRAGQVLTVQLPLVSLGDVPDKYRTDVFNYLNLNLNDLIQGAIELGEQFDEDQDL